MTDPSTQFARLYQRFTPLRHFDDVHVELLFDELATAVAQSGALFERPTKIDFLIHLHQDLPAFEFRWTAHFRYDVDSEAIQVGIQTGDRPPFFNNGLPLSALWRDPISGRLFHFDPPGYESEEDRDAARYSGAYATAVSDRTALEALLELCAAALRQAEYNTVHDAEASFLAEHAALIAKYHGRLTLEEDERGRYLKLGSFNGVIPWDYAKVFPPAFFARHYHGVRFVGLTLEAERQAAE